MAVADVTPEQMQNLDIVILLDMSGSMSFPLSNDSAKRTRFAATKEEIRRMAYLAGQYDNDGIQVITFQGPGAKTIDGVTAEKLDSLLAMNPGGGTPLHLALDNLDAIVKASTKDVVALCYTDGEPDSRDMAKKKIVAMAKEHGEKVNVMFIQVDSDPAAAAFLRELDDDMGALTGGIDIVDTKTLDEVSVMDASQVIANAMAD